MITTDKNKFGGGIAQLGKNTPTSKTSTSVFGSAQYIIDLISAKYGVNPLSIKPIYENIAQRSINGILRTKFADDFLIKNSKQVAIFYGSIKADVTGITSGSILLNEVSNTLNGTLNGGIGFENLVTLVKNFEQVNHCLVTDSHVQSTVTTNFWNLTYSGYLIKIA